MIDLDIAVKKIRNKWKTKKWLNYIYYRKYIKSIYWSKKRNLKLSKKPNCECCWILAECVHHETYHRLWKERMEDLRSLCNDCHQKIHFIYNQWKNSKKTLSRAFIKLRQDINIYPYSNK